MATDRFTQFKKCITWTKNFNTWSGCFQFDESPRNKRYCYSAAAMPGEGMRTAKVNIAERIFQDALEFAMIHGLDFDAIIAEQIAAKQKAKKSK